MGTRSMFTIYIESGITCKSPSFERITRRKGKLTPSVKREIERIITEIVMCVLVYDVERVYIGYPKFAILDPRPNGRSFIYNYSLLRFLELSEDNGISAFIVDERGTSKVCPIHGDGCGKRKGPVLKCTKTGMKFDADIVAAFNILKKSEKDIIPCIECMLWNHEK